MSPNMHAGGRVKLLLGWVGLAALSLAGLACASDTAAPAPAPTAAQLLPPITAAIGPAACDASTQCRSIGVGAKACGGPEGYRAWSVKDADESALRAAVAAHTAARQVENLRSDMRTNCALEIDPGASCQAGRCVINPRGLGGGNLAQ